MPVSILMLTHNAPRYVWKSIWTVRRRTRGGRPELVVVDNASRLPTRALCRCCKAAGLIDVLFLNPENALFAGGNNIAAGLACAQSSFYLLLNSDIEVRDEAWLEKLLACMEDPKVGAVAYGSCLNEPIRADGYCFLVRRELFDRYQMDEDFQWWWSMTKLEAKILQAGYDIVAFTEHERMLHHFGGKSGDGWQGARGMDVAMAEVLSWFEWDPADHAGTVRIIDDV